MNYFENLNSEPVHKWIFRRSDSLEQLVFYFLSKKNSTSARYFPLFNSSKGIRLVYLNGLSIPRTDLLMLKIYKLILFIFKFKISKYTVFHNLSSPVVTSSIKQVLHVDDPTYSKVEKQKLFKWEAKVTERNCQPIIVCTNQYTESWLKTVCTKSKIIIIQQGYIPAKKKQVSSIKNNRFSCVYSSPYIHIGKDKHARHQTWGAELLVTQIIPKIFSSDTKIDIHLIGEIGSEAKAFLIKFPNVICHGRVDFVSNIEIMSRCHIALYPRNIDLFRSMTKIFSYIGESLPIVTFELIDTLIVKKQKLGISVNTNQEFVDAVLYLKNNPQAMFDYITNINSIKNNFTWSNLAMQMNTEIYGS